MRGAFRKSHKLTYVIFVPVPYLEKQIGEKKKSKFAWIWVATKFSSKFWIAVWPKASNKVHLKQIAVFAAIHSEAF